MAGLTAEILQFLCIVSDGVFCLISDGMQQIVPVKADRIIVMISVHLEILHTGADQIDAGRRGSQRISGIEQTGGHPDPADTFSVLVNGHGVILFVDQRAVMQAGRDHGQFFRLDPAFHIFADGLAPGSHPAPAAVDFQHTDRGGPRRNTSAGGVFFLFHQIQALAFISRTDDGGGGQGGPDFLVVLRIRGDDIPGLKDSRNGNRGGGQGDRGSDPAVREICRIGGEEIIPLGQDFVLPVFSVPLQRDGHRILCFSLQGAQDFVRLPGGSDFHFHAAFAAQSAFDAQRILLRAENIRRGQTADGSAQR